jgi:5-methylcytosine-specific restriction endonuclease McrA
VGKRLYDWSAIQRYHDEGHSKRECELHFGFTGVAWNKAVRRGELQPRAGAKFGRARPDDGRRRYDWAQIQAYYDAGHSFRQCLRKFGFCAASWQKARERGEINARPAAMSIEQLLARGKSRYNVKKRLLRAGLLRNECFECGLTHWRGRKLSLHIDHINGVNNDHRLENLRLLCPNCHSQTETYGGLNMKRRRSTLQEPPEGV